MKLSTKALFYKEKLISKKKLSSKNTYSTSTNKALLKPRTSKRLSTCLNKEIILNKENPEPKKQEIKVDDNLGFKQCEYCTNMFENLESHLKNVKLKN